MIAISNLCRCLELESACRGLTVKFIARHPVLPEGLLAGLGDLLPFRLVEGSHFPNMDTAAIASRHDLSPVVVVNDIFYASTVNVPFLRDQSKGICNGRQEQVSFGHGRRFGRQPTGIPDFDRVVSAPGHNLGPVW